MKFLCPLCKKDSSEREVRAFKNKTPKYYFCDKNDSKFIPVLNKTYCEDYEVYVTAYDYFRAKIKPGR